VKFKLRISPDGKTVFGLYSDKLPWKSLGELEIHRATDIRFNAAKQAWEVYLVHEGQPLPGTYLFRENAVKAEVDYLQYHIGLWNKCYVG